MDLGLAGKVALVLGGSRGLGAASAQALHAEGAAVHAVSRSGTSPAPGIAAVNADLASRESVDALIERIADIGPVDILVASTGGPRRGGAQGIASEEWISAFDALAVSLFRVADAVLPGMIDRGWGRILTVGSNGIEQPIPNLALSNAIRGSVAGWSKTLAGEVAPHGVTVNMVLPGRMDTDRLRQGNRTRAETTGVPLEEIQARSQADIPMGRFGQAGEFGDVVAFLASTRASYITGSMLRVDGGLIRSI